MPRRAVVGEARRHALNMKTTEVLRRQLEDAAKKSGRTLSHEVEYRLEKSIADDQSIEGVKNNEILRDIRTFLILSSVDMFFENKLQETYGGKDKMPVPFSATVTAREATIAGVSRIISGHLPDRPGFNSASEGYPSEDELKQLRVIFDKIAGHVLQASAIEDLIKIGWRWVNPETRPRDGESMTEFAWRMSAPGSLGDLNPGPLPRPLADRPRASVEDEGGKKDKSKKRTGKIDR